MAPPPSIDSSLGLAQRTPPPRPQALAAGPRPAAATRSPGQAQNARNAQSAQNTHNALWPRRDRLTGLADATLLMRHLERAIAARRSAPLAGALLLVQVEHFHQQRMYLGFNGGENLLVLLAARLQRRCPVGARLARVGESCFAVLLGPLGDRREASLAAASLVDVLREPLPLRLLTGDAVFPPLQVEVAIGVCAFAAQETNAESVLRSATAGLQIALSYGGSAVRSGPPTAGPSLS